MADTLVMVEFCGGPCEGRHQTVSTAVLPLTIAVRIPYPLAATVYLSRPAPAYPTHRTARYVLHREGASLAYVHAGNTDD